MFENYKKLHLWRKIAKEIQKEMYSVFEEPAYMCILARALDTHCFLYEGDTWRIIRDEIRSDIKASTFDQYLRRIEGKWSSNSYVNSKRLEYANSKIEALEKVCKNKFLLWLYR